MKKVVLALTALTALAATPAFAGGTHISFGFYSPAPVYVAPAPVAYYPPVQRVYYAPAPRPCPQHYVYDDHRRHGRGYGWGNRDYAYGYGGGWYR